MNWLEQQGIQPTDPSGQTAKDFKTDQDVRWCPGCGDYSILAQVQRVLPSLGIPKENYVFISGIGCSSRFPYYMDTYGLHSIHGRAPALVTGLKAVRPDLSVWMITGDGDALSIGGNHLIHILRRNVDVNILLFNNRIYGLTKGQYSPTSEEGKKTKSSPMGSLDHPFNPLALALAADGTFVARTLDVDPKHMQETLKAAAAHKGTSLVEIYQNCNIFNDGAFAPLSDRRTRPDHALTLTHGQPLIFGKERQHCVVMDSQFNLVVANTAEVDEAQIIVHDQHNITLAQMLARLTPPSGPTPMGVLYQTERPCYEDQLNAQVEAAQSGGKATGVQSLLESGYTWTVD